MRKADGHSDLEDMKRDMDALGKAAIRAGILKRESRPAPAGKAGPKGAGKRPKPGSKPASGRKGA